MRKLMIAVILFFSFYCSSSQNGRLSEQIGNVKKVTTLPHGVAFQLSDAYAEITAYNPTTVRVRVAKQKFAKDFSFAIDDLSSHYNFKNVSSEGNKKILMTDSLKVIVNTQPFRVSFYNLKNEFLCGDDESLGISWWGDEVSCYRKLNSDEKFIGLGEKTGGINRRGHYYRNWNSDIPAYALDQDPLYATIPFFIGIHGDVCYGTFFDNTHESYFNFGGGADEELYHFGAVDGE